jgi:hypothetical protein
MNPQTSSGEDTLHGPRKGEVAISHSASNFDSKLLPKLVSLSDSLFQKELLRNLSSGLVL